MPPAREPYWTARAREQDTAYWDDRAELDRLAAVIDPEGTRRKNDYVHALHSRALKKLRIGPSDDVLDFGCGTGRNLGLLSDRAAEVVGVDTSPRMVELAASVAATLPNCTVRLMEGGSVPLPDGSFDIVVTVLVLQMLATDEESFQAAAREIDRLLRPHGRLAMIERVEPAGSLALSNWFALLERAGYRLESAVSVRRGSPSLLGRLVVAGALPMGSSVLALDEWLNGRSRDPAPYSERLMIARRA